MKVYVKIALLSVLTFLTATPVFASTVIYQIDNPKMSVNGETRNIDNRGTNPVIIDGSTLVPLRSIVEGLGGEVEWDEKEKKIILSHGTEKSAIWLNQTKITVLESANKFRLEWGVYYNGATPVIINDITMVPARLVASALGLQTWWFPHNKLVVITDSVTPSPIVPPGESAFWGDTAQTFEEALHNLLEPKIGPGLPYLNPGILDEVAIEVLNGYDAVDLDNNGNLELLLLIGLWEGSYTLAYTFENGKMNFLGRIHADYIETSTGYIVSTGGDAGYTPDIAYKYSNGKFEPILDYVQYGYNGDDAYLKLGEKTYHYDSNYNLDGVYTINYINLE